jgi:hypothetical protein
MPDVVEANSYTVLVMLTAACGLLILAVIIHALRIRRDVPASGDERLGRELREIGRRMATLENGVAQILEALPRSVQGVGMLRYNPFPEMGGNLSFSLALLDARANGVVISVLNDRHGSHVYGKPLEQGASAAPLSEEEQQAVALARGRKR